MRQTLPGRFGGPPMHVPRASAGRHPDQSHSISHGAQCSRRPPASTPTGRQPKGICLLAPCAVKAACTVRGRGQGLIRRSSSNPLCFSPCPGGLDPPGGVRAGNGAREEMPACPDCGERWCKPTLGWRGKAAQPMPQTMAVQAGATPASASRTKRFGGAGGADGDRGRTRKPEASTDSLNV